MRIIRKVMSSSVQFGKVWYGIVWFEKARLDLASRARYGYFDVSPTFDNGKADEKLTSTNRSEPDRSVEMQI